MPPEWTLELTYELWRWGGVDGQSVWDLVNTSQPYPRAVPIMLSWLSDFEERANGPVTRWNIGTREGLNRALTVPEARGTAAPDVMIMQLSRRPLFEERVLFSAANALKYLAEPKHYNQIADIVRTRVEGRSPLIEWIAASRRQSSLRIVVDQLDDPEVATWVMKVLRRRQLPPDLIGEVRQQVQEYLRYPGESDGLAGELRKQARLTLVKLPPEPGAERV